MLPDLTAFKYESKLSNEKSASPLEVGLDIITL